MFGNRRWVARALTTLTVCGLTATICEAPAGASPGSGDNAAATLHAKPSAASCADVRPDPTATGTAICRLDPAALPAAERAQIAPRLKAARSSLAAAQCQRDVLDYDRTTSCVSTENAFQIFIPQTGEILGYADFEVISGVGLDVRTRHWTQRLAVTLLLAEGEASTGFLAYATALFPDSAGFAATPSPDLEVTVIGQQVDFDYQIDSPGTATVQGAVQPTFLLTPLAPVEGPPIEYEIGTPPAVRCDSTPFVGPATGGCVYYQFVPTYDVSTTNNDTAQVAWHILWAQRNLVNHWGWQGHGPALTRTRSRTLIAANRQVACGRRRPVPGRSCDEYPFATTQEGASLNPDYSWHMVNARQNRLEGSRYRNPWYNQNRMLEGDKFWVNVILPPGPAVTSIPGFDN